MTIFLDPVLHTNIQMYIDILKYILKFYAKIGFLLLRCFSSFVKSYVLCVHMNILFSKILKFKVAMHLNS